MEPGHPPNGLRRRDDTGSRPASLRSVPILVGSMSLIGLVLVAGTALVEVKAIRSRADVNEMLANALPSTELLTQVSGALGQVDTELDRAVTAATDGQALDWAPVIRSRQRISAIFDSYRMLPTYPGELVFQRHILDSLTEMDIVVASMNAALGRADVVAASRLDNTDWRTASDRVDEQVRELIVFNIGHAAAHAHSLDTLWYELALLSAALALLLLLFGGLGTWAAARAVTRQLRYEEARSGELEMFAGRVAHDILSPLASTHMALRVASKSEGSKLESAVRSAASSLTRAQQVVESLLSFATSGGTPRRGQRTSVAAALGAARADLGPEAEAATIALECQAGEGGEVACGSEILAIVLSNLVRNSIKFMGESSVRRISISARTQDREVRFEVSDTGPGLPAGFATEAFRAYSRGQDDRPGLGLGLATVKRLVESYGGQVGLRSVPGQGTAVWFVLPRVEGTLVVNDPAAA